LPSCGIRFTTIPIAQVHSKSIFTPASFGKVRSMQGPNSAATSRDSRPNNWRRCRTGGGPSAVIGSSQGRSGSRTRPDPAD
jgi:hypothetical protein